MISPCLFLTLFYLCRPDLTVKKRRGGKRMRRMKERYEETAMMKQANTRAFSTKAGEYGDDASEFFNVCTFALASFACVL